MKLSLSNEGINKRGEHLHKYTYGDDFFNRQWPILSSWGTEKEAYRHKKTYISANKHVVLIMHASTVL